MVDNFRLTVDSNTEIEPLETVRDVRMKGQTLVDNRVATIPQMTGATSSSNGSAGVVPTPSVGDREKFLRGDGTWAEASGSGGSNVSVDQILDDGVNIMDITIDNVTTHIYAPESDPNAVVDVVDANGDSLVDEYRVAHIAESVTDVVDANGDSLVDENGVAHVTGEVVDVLYNDTSVVDENGVAKIYEEKNITTLPLLDYANITYIQGDTLWTDSAVHEWTAPCDCVVIVRDTRGNNGNTYIKYTIGDFEYWTTCNNMRTDNVPLGLYSDMMPVKKGQTIGIQLMGIIDTQYMMHKAYYIPYKTIDESAESFPLPYLDHANRTSIDYSVTSYTATTDGLFVCASRSKFELTVNSSLVLYGEATASNYFDCSVLLSSGDTITGFGTGSKYFIPLKRTDDIHKLVSPVPDYKNAIKYTADSLPQSYNDYGFIFICGHESTATWSASAMASFTTAGYADTIYINAKNLQLNNNYYWKDGFLPIDPDMTKSYAGSSGNPDGICFYFIPYSEFSSPYISDVIVNGVSVVDENGVANITNGGGGSTVSVTQKVSSGENIASITVDGVATELYATNTTYSDFVGATAQVGGSHGLVPAPTTSDVNKYLKSDGTWATVSGGGGGSTITITPSLVSGIKVADYNIDGTDGSLFAPISADDMTLSEYNALTTEQKNDGTIRFITKSGEVDVDMSAVSIYNQSNITVTATSASVTTSWNGTANNLNCVYYIAMDLTNVNTIKYNVSTTTSFSRTSGNRLFVGFASSAPTSTSWNVSGYEISNIEDTNNSGVLHRTLDVSEYTGTHYFVVKANGWNSTVGAVQMVSNDNPTQIKYMSETYALDTGSDVSVTQVLSSGTKIATITIDGTDTDFYAPNGGGGGSTISVTQKVSTGENIASITVDGVATELYATNTTYSDFDGATSQVVGTHGLVPAPTTSDTTKFLKGDGTWGTPDSGSDVSVTQIQSTGTKIATVTIDNVDTDLYAPNGGGGGSTVSIDRKVSTGENFADITIDGVTTSLYATNTTYSNFTGTDGTAAGTNGLVPAPTASDTNKYLKSDGTWATVSGGGGASSLDDLSDVNITTPLDSQILKYDGTSQEWVNSIIDANAYAYYLNNGNIGGGSSSSTWTTLPLLQSMTNGFYIAYSNDSGTTGTSMFEWSGTSLTITTGSIQYRIDQDSVTATNYTGAWRDIYLSIIKLGSESGGEYERTPLYITPITTVGEVTLDDEITNYDDIEFIVSGNGTTGVFRCNTTEFINSFPNVASPTTSTPHFLLSPYASMYCRSIMGTDNNKINIFDISNVEIESIYGIKYGSGGGGGASTLEDLTDITITTPSNGQVLKYNSTSQKWENGTGGGGNANMTELTQVEYDALTPSEKENGTMYLTHDGDEEVDLTVRMVDYTSTSGTASAVGSYNANFLAWHAFASEDDFDANLNGEYWAGNGEGAYLQFDFANAVSITKVAYASYQYSSFDLMYSTDGTTYNLAETLTQADQGTTTPTKQDYILSEPIASVISIRFVCNGAYNIGALHIYGNDGNLSPNRIYLNSRKYAEVSDNNLVGEEMTLADYSALPSATKNDGAVRFIPHSNIGSIQPIDMTTQAFYQDSGNMNVTDTTSTKTTVTWNGGMNIGCSYYYATAIDVTDWDRISLDIHTGSCYGGGASAQRPAWDFTVGLLDYQIAAAVDLPASSSAWKVVADLPASNHDYSGTELDVSSLTGELYLTVICHGWNATVENITISTLGGYPSQIKYMDETYGIANIKELTEGEYNDLPNSEKNNGTVYFTYDGGYEYISYDNGAIIVRVDHTNNKTLWFFNGFAKNADDMDIPTELVPYLPTQTSAQSVMMAKDWTDSTSTTTDGWIGFVYPGTQNVKIRSWNTTHYTDAVAGWAVLDIDGSTAEDGQTEPYQNPYTSTTMQPNHIYMNGRCYSEKAVENVIPDAPTTDGTYTLTVTVSDGEPTYSWETTS